MLNEESLDALQLQEKLRAELGWRVGDEAAHYILDMIAAGASTIPILAADARTGHPIAADYHPSSSVPAPKPAAPPPQKPAGEQFLLFPT